MKRQSVIKSLETLSIVAFGLAYFKYDLYVATGVLMATMTLFVATVKFLGESLTKLQLLSWMAILILGGATLLFQNDAFIKWKPTVVNSIVATIFVLSHLIGQKTLVERFLASKMDAPALKLRRINAACSLFFFFLAYLNFQIAFSFSTSVWVNYKIFGNLLLNIIFITSCLYYLREHLQDIVNGPPRS